MATNVATHLSGFRSDHWTASLLALTQQASGQFTPPSTEEISGQSTPSSTAETSGQFTPPSTVEISGQSTPPSTAETSGQFTPPSTVEISGQSTQPSTAEISGQFTPPSTTEISGHTTPPSIASTQQVSHAGTDLTLSPTSGLTNDELIGATTVDVQTSQSCSGDLLTPAEITPIFVKSRNRRNFAALLSERLFDVSTRMKSNVRGWRKEQLDPEIIKYIKAKCFEYFQLNNPGEEKEAWSACIKAIDDKSRSIKKQKMFMNYYSE